MKAVVYGRYGPPEVLQLTDIPKPAPRDIEVLIRVDATTVTIGDVRMRSFTVPRGDRRVQHHRSLLVARHGAQKCSRSSNRLGKEQQ